ncbi:hypothetical protein ACVSQB_33015 [Bradyrhizobium elkanii]
MSPETFLQHLREQAISGAVILSPADFIRALELRAIEYITKHGVSINGSFVGEVAPCISGSPVYVSAA